MIRFVCRLLGFVLLAAGFIFLVYDGTKSIAGNAIFLTKLGQTWSDIHQTSLLLLQPAIERHVSVWLWDPVLLTVLQQPTWLVLGILGGLLILIGRRKKRLIGWARD
jgi:hypothetical protein